MCLISIVGALVSVTCPTPVSTTADAVRILAPHAYVAPAPQARGPRVLVIHSSTTDGPFGPFPTSPPTRPSCCDVYVHYHPRGGRR